jgi:hypothetical protein
MSMPRTEIVHDDAVLRMVVSRNLIVCAWADAPGVEHIRSVSRVAHGVVSRYKEHRAFLNLAHAGTPRFSDAVRDELVKLIRDTRLQGQGTAYVVSIPGIAGATVRAFLSTVMLVARPIATHKVFGDLAPAAAWLVPKLTTGGEAWTSTGVLAVAADATGKAPARGGSETGR